ncbi:MAG: Gp15 family bacteriophage protein [Mediterraneibacter faecis]
MANDHIVDVLPETVEIDGAEYRINPDFRISILFELLMQDDEVGKTSETYSGLKLYYPEIPQNMTRSGRENDLVLQMRQRNRKRSLRIRKKRIKASILI